ncbi:MAG: carbohydrate ABC transporter permease, partial [Caldilineaceae bacterium]
MKRQQTLATTLSYVVVIGALMIFLFPIVWMILGSLKTPSQMFEVSLPIPPTLENYRVVFDSYPIGRFLGNSLRVAFFSTTLSVFVGSLAAYALTRHRFRGSNAMLLGALGMRMLPGIAVSIPLYLLFSRIDLTNTTFGLVLAHCAIIQIPLVIWIMYGFLQDIPYELAEAGLVDGCTRFSVIWRIILPLAAPGLAVAA